MKLKSIRRVHVLFGVLVITITGLILFDKGDIADLGECVSSGSFVSLPAEPVDFERDYFGYTWKGNTTNLIDASIYLAGAWERPILYGIRDALKRPNNEKGVFLDIGANVGTHSFFASRYAKTVHAVEPWPTVLHRLDTFIKREKITNVKIHPVGYSDKKGEMPFTIPPGANLGMGSFSPTQLQGKKVIQLPLVVGDEDLKAHGVQRIDVIKIDIEGFEKPALKGLALTLARDRPVVFLELNTKNDEGFHSSKELKATFPKDYAFYELSMGKDFLFSLPDGSRRGCVQVSGKFQYTILPEDVFGKDARPVAAIPKEKVKGLLELGAKNKG